MSEEIVRTVDDAVIKSWIASLELLAQDVQADWEYNTAVGGEWHGDADWDKHDAYMQLIATAKQALKALCHE